MTLNSEVNSQSHQTEANVGTASIASAWKVHSLQYLLFLSDTQRQLLYMLPTPRLAYNGRYTSVR